MADLDEDEEIIKDYEELIGQMDKDIKFWKRKEAKWRSRLDPSCTTFAKQVAKINAAVEERKRYEKSREEAQQGLHEFKEKLRKEKEEDAARKR
ncbi:hypothetical protein Hte_008118 [Hypoxylon texense]